MDFIGRNTGIKSDIREFTGNTKRSRMIGSDINANVLRSELYRSYDWARRQSSALGSVALWQERRIPKLTLPQADLGIKGIQEP